MNCDKCGVNISIRSVCRLIKYRQGEVKAECLVCPSSVNKVLIQKAYVDFCQQLQALCENGVELNNALVSAHNALEWAQKAV